MPGEQIPLEFYWGLPHDQLLVNLDSSINGLTDAEAARRLSQTGPNSLKGKQKTTAFGLFINQFKSPIIIILLFATGISAFLKDWTDSLIILLIILGSASLSFYQEYNASNAAEKLRSQVSLKSITLRDDQAVSIPSELIVPGDVVLLSAGSLIPADGILLETDDLFVNQAVLTGETFPIEKKPSVVPAEAGLSDRSNTVFMGTSVRSGSGKVLIVRTGQVTEFGKIADRLALRPPETEFERGIRRLGYLLTEVMLILVLIIFALNVFLKKPPMDSLLFSIALAVGLTPQLLPAIININLSKGSQAMASKGVIVRRLEAIENFGSMDVLCTDKTGTLTEGVVKLDASLDTAGHPSDNIRLYAYLNAFFESGLTNPLDEAIRNGLQPDIQGFEKIDEIPYDFIRKRLSVVVKKDERIMLVTKGALENILDICNRVLVNGEPVAFDPEKEEGVCRLYSSWSEQGYRVLGLAIKELGNQTTVYPRESEEGMIFVGFLLFFDPPKEGVKETIADLSKMGVNLKIITGDNRLVAEHAADAVGLVVSKILTGPQLNELRDEALWYAAEQTALFAEVDPNQKERIILELKKTGHVVGYMGDGINDAPALHSADVSISVDNAVDVAKEAADFVLLKQDLAVLKQGIEQGRKTFANTLKYVFMATSANFGNMFSMAGASLFLPFLPMLPKQILLINFLADLPEITIAGDNVDQVYIERPHRWDIKFIRRFMLVFGPLSSFFDFLTFGVLLWGLHASEALFHTGWFVESVISASLVVFAIRTRLPFWRSKPSKSMLVVTGNVILVTIALPYSPLATLLGFQPLPAAFLIVLAVIISLYFLSAELVKRWFYKQYQRKDKIFPGA